MNEVELQKDINKGAEAEQFKQYLESNPYFLNVVVSAKEIIRQNILALHPDEQLKFTCYRSQEMAIDDLMGMIDNDIFVGQKAIQSMQDMFAMPDKTDDEKSENLKPGDVL